MIEFKSLELTKIAAVGKVTSHLMRRADKRRELMGAYIMSNQQI